VPYMAPTKVMMLGKLRAATVDEFDPQLDQRLRTTFLSPRRITPQQPQNLLRQGIMGGIGATGRMLAGLAGEAEAVPTTGFDATMAEAQRAASVIDPNTGLPVTGVALPAPVGSSTVSFGGGMLSGAVLVLASAALSAYHGYRRDRKPMSAVGWGFMGALFPVITPVVAIAQGFGKPRRR